jgi:hypothetical protein
MAFNSPDLLLYVLFLPVRSPTIIMFSSYWILVEVNLIPYVKDVETSQPRYEQDGAAETTGVEMQAVTSNNGTHLISHPTSPTHTQTRSNLRH